jgi:septum formation protein
MNKLILASTSKIRQHILADAGLVFESQKPDVNEELAKSKYNSLSAKDLALALAKDKAQSLSEPTRFILGADQTLSCEGVVYNKPASLKEAYEQLISLRGKTHTLHSALAIAQKGKIIWCVCEGAHLTMRNFSDKFAKSYVEACGEALLTTVGAYQLENRGAQLFEKIDGDYFTILGLPLLPCLAFLRDIKFMPS